MSKHHAKPIITEVSDDGRSYTCIPRCMYRNRYIQRRFLWLGWRHVE